MKNYCGGVPAGAGSTVADAGSSTCVYVGTTGSLAAGSLEMLAGDSHPV